MLLFSDTKYKKHPITNRKVIGVFPIFFIVLIYCFALWHASCIILTSGSFTSLCQPLRDVLHKLRMTHNKVPAVQQMIIALLYQPSGETLS